jgi:hypothetical protein
VKAAKSAGAGFVLTLHGADAETRHTWSPDPPPEWKNVITELGL